MKVLELIGLGEASGDVLFDTSKMNNEGVHRWVKTKSFHNEFTL